MQFKESVELVLVRGVGANRRVLLSQRSAGKHGAGTIALPGGHIEALQASGRPETIREAVIREAREELGDSVAAAIRTVFGTGKVRVGACVDDLQQDDELYYRHLGVRIELPEGVEPDETAIDHAEYVDLRWRTLSEVTELVNAGRIYPPRTAQIASFLADVPRYVESVSAL